MATPSFVQASTLESSGTGNTIALELSNVSVGSTILVAFGQTASSAATYTVTDDADHTYTAVVNTPGDELSRRLGLYYTVVTTGGALTITVQSSSSVLFYGLAVEAGEIAESDPVAAFAENTDLSASQHYCAPSGEIDVPEAAFCFAAGILVASNATLTAQDSFTILGSHADNRFYVGYRITDDAVADLRAGWQSSSARSSVSGVMALVGPSAVPSERGPQRGLLVPVFTRPHTRRDAM